MAENSKIEWTDHTFNPWTGCTKVSPGCDHCYAESWAKRSGTVRWGAGEPRRRTTGANWRLPLRWNAQAEREGRRFRVFCSSLADVFDNAVPPEWRADLLNLIADTPHLDWLLLTKRIGNAHQMLDDYCGSDGHTGERWDGWQNVWLGATVVNQEEADRDIPKLLQLPARVRFLSIEPMLGPITLSDFLPEMRRLSEAGRAHNAIHWIICGGESGPGARPMHPDWARSLRDQCKAAGVPFLFKQWGEWVNPAHASNETDRVLPERWLRPDGSTPGADVDFFGGDEVTYRYGKKAAGRLLDGVQHDGFPEVA